MTQVTNNILMIRPISFGLNIETSINNHYQNKHSDVSLEESQSYALIEFDAFVEKLQMKGVNVVVIEDVNDIYTPDSIFPNNWISTHSDGTIYIYPMFAKNRRLERRYDIIEYLRDHFEVKNLLDNAEDYERENNFLEGTGSMVLDRDNKIAYASISERTNNILFEKWCELMGFFPVAFTSYHTKYNERELIYHTNVMMCIADKYVIICLDSIDSTIERDFVCNMLKSTNKEIIEISELQIDKFAGNMLQVMGDQKYLVMSESAYSSLTESQLETIRKYNDIIYSSLDIIQDLGGGSARCMMAEIFLKPK